MNYLPAEIPPLEEIRAGYLSLREQPFTARQQWAATTLAKLGRLVDPQVRRWLKRLASNRYAPAPLIVLNVKTQGGNPSNSLNSEVTQ